MTKLSVNLNKVALLRNARSIGIPSVLEAAQTCVQAGAHGVTVHPRPDERHTKAADVYALAELLAAAPGVEFNIEGNPFPRFMEIVRRVKPTQCTLVPDGPEAFTSDHGWNLAKNAEESKRLAPIIEELKGLGIRVSLFMDADSPDIERAKEIGADRIELYTASYAAAYGNEIVFERYAIAAKKAQEVGLGVNAGHDLNLKNLGKFCSIPDILEVSIGHALIADALWIGLFNAVQAYLKVLSECHPPAAPSKE
jgi:pyridoxine 5-phosphate synthase